MKHSYSNREIRIFLSSTFEDLMAERDFLVKKTFQRLRAEANSRNVNLTVLDLRWGVSEEESKNGKVLRVCLEEIMNSHPFFIGLVGDRYGWCPSDSEIEDSVKSEYEWIRNDIKNKLSITEIEMQFGALRRFDDDTKAVFFVKSNYDILKEKDNIDKFQKFRQKVKNNGRFPVYDFSSIAELDRLIYTSIIRLLDELYPKQPLTAHQQERFNQDAYVSRRKLNYVENKEYFQSINDFVHNEEESYLAITSESGLGKSSLIANWLMRGSDDTRIIKTAYFVGCGGNGVSSTTILQYLIEDICELTEFDILKIKDRPGAINFSTKELLEMLLVEVSQQSPILILIDGVNQLHDFDDDNSLGWLPKLPPRCKLIISTILDSKTLQSLEKRNCKLLELQPLNVEERSILVQKYLAYYGKKLNPNQLNRLLYDNENENTLVLCSLLDELIGFGSFKELDETIEYYLQAHSIPDFFQLVVSRYAKDFGSSFVRDVLSSIYLSHYGLTENEIIKITDCTNLEWSEFYCAFKNYLVSKSGVLDFSHTYIREAVKIKFIDDEGDFCAYCRKRIIKGVKVSPNNHYTRRECAEIPFQYYKLKKYDDLHRFLIDGVFPLTHLFAHEKDVLFKYWRCLYNETNYSYKDYLAIDTDAVQNELFDAGDTSNLIVYGFFDKLIELSFLVDKTVAEKAAEKGLLWVNTYLDGSSGVFVPSFVFSIYKTLSNVYSYWGDVSHARSCLYKLIEIAEKENHHYGKQTTNYAELLLKTGMLDHSEGKYSVAETNLVAALSICIKTAGEISLETSDCYMRLGELYLDTHEYDKAIDNLEKAVKLKTILYGNFDSSIPYYALGKAFIRSGKINEAEQQLEYLENVYSLCSERESDINSVNNLGLLYEEFAQYYNQPDYNEKAIGCFEKACEIAESVSWKDSPMIIQLKLNQIGNYLRNNNNEKALNLLDDVLRVYETLSEEKRFQCNKQAGAVYCRLKQFNLSEKHFQKAISQSTILYGNQSIETAICYNNIAALYAFKKDFEQALSYYDTAITIYIANNREIDTEVITMYFGKATIYFKDLHKYRDAAENYKQALNICLELYGTKSRKTTWFYFQLGKSYFMAYMLDEAYSALSCAFNGYKDDYKENGRDYSSMMATLSVIAEVQIKLGLMDAAKTNAGILFNQFCLEERAKMSNAQGDAYFLMGLINYSEGKNKEALDFFMKTLVIREKCEPESNDLKKVYIKIANCYESEGELENALTYYQKAIPLIELYYGENSLDMAETYNNIGGIYMKLDDEDYEKALLYCEKGLKIKVEILGEENQMVAMSYMNRGILHYYRNEYKQAINDCKRAVSIYKAIKNERCEYVAMCNDHIGMALYRLGKKQEGDSYFNDSLSLRKSLYPEDDDRIRNSIMMKWLVEHTVPKTD